MELVGSTDPGDIITGLGQVEHAGVMGTISFDEIGDVSVPGGAGTELIPRFEYTGGTWVFME